MGKRWQKSGEDTGGRKAESSKNRKIIGVVGKEGNYDIKAIVATSTFKHLPRNVLLLLYLIPNQHELVTVESSQSVLLGYVL